MAANSDAWVHWEKARGAGHRHPCVCITPVHVGFHHTERIKAHQLQIPASKKQTNHQDFSTLHPAAPRRLGDSLGLGVGSG